MDEEGLTKTANDLIYIGHKINFDQSRFAEDLAALRELEEGQESLLRSRLQTLVPTYTPSANKVGV
jgi:hypothetical protein